MRGAADGVELNGVAYRVPDAPVAVVCVDGGDPEYFEAARAAGCIPTVSRFMSAGFSAVAHCGIPSFTCPNNISIATGAAPKVHGISGTFYLDRATGQAVVMTGPQLMRARTVFDVLSKAGAGTAVVTAKDKLRTQLGKGLDVAAGNVCFSSQHADRCTGAENGIADALGLFHALPHHPKLIGVLEQLLGGPVWVHPRHIVHAIFPADLDYTTPPHQAFHPVRGAPDIWTAWVPFGDCDAPLGGLAVVP